MLIAKEISKLRCCPSWWESFGNVFRGNDVIMNILSSQPRACDWAMFPCTMPRETSCWCPNTSSRSTSWLGHWRSSQMSSSRPTDVWRMRKRKQTRSFQNKLCFHKTEYSHPNSKVHGANMGPTWGRQDPGGPHVSPINFAISTRPGYTKLRPDIKIVSGANVSPGPQNAILSNGRAGNMTH